MMRQQLKLTMEVVAVAVVVQVQQRVGHRHLPHWQQTLPHPWLALVLQQLRRVVGVEQSQDNEC
jgi:hypothetical protein